MVGDKCTPPERCHVNLELPKCRGLELNVTDS